MAKTKKVEEESKEPKDLTRLMAEINRKAGSRVIGRMDTMTDFNIERIPTNIKVLDDALGGGFPTRRVVELYGLPSGGKSLISLLLIASAQKQGKSCVYIDVEDSFDPEHAKKLGVDTNTLIIAHLGIGEEILNLICTILEARPDVIVVDSVAAMVAVGEMDEGLEKASMALKARLMSKGLPKISALNKNTCIVFINQLRDTMAMYGAPTTTPGGRALPYYASIRLEIKKGDLINKDDKKTNPVIGQIINFIVRKNKTAPPFKLGSFKYFYDGEIVEPGKRRKNEATNNIKTVATT